MSAWLDHVEALQKKNPSKSLKEVLKMASKTYKKSSGKTAKKSAAKKGHGKKSHGKKSHGKKSHGKKSHGRKTRRK